MRWLPYPLPLVLSVACPDDVVPCPVPGRLRLELPAVAGLDLSLSLLPNVPSPLATFAPVLADPATPPPLLFLIPNVSLLLDAGSFIPEPATLDPPPTDPEDIE